MNQYTTEKGTKLFYYVSYDKGGYNHFTSEMNARGYNIHVQRNERVTRAFTGLSDDCGAVKKFLFEVGRQSKKQMEKAENMALDEVKQIAEYYNL